MSGKTTNVTVVIDGIKFEGPPRKIMEILESRYPMRKISGDFYMSSSSGPVPINNMATNHLKNAYLKLTFDIIQDLRWENDLASFLQKAASLESGCDAGDCTRKRMLEVLYSRLVGGQRDFSWYKR